MAVWVCLKYGSENMLSVRLLQIGATDITVRVMMQTLTIYQNLTSSIGFSRTTILKELVLRSALVAGPIFSNTAQ